MKYFYIIAVNILAGIVLFFYIQHQDIQRQDKIIDDAVKVYETSGKVA